MDIRKMLAAEEACGRLHVMQGVETMPDAVAETVTVRRYARDAYMLRDFEEASEVFFLLRGSARAVNRQPEGEEYPIATFRAPVVFGEHEAFAERRRYLSNVVCATECLVMCMPSAVYLRWVRGDPELLYARAREIIRTLSHQARWERSQLFLNARRRICLYLYDNAVPCREGGSGYEVCETRCRIGDGTGYSEKTVQRELTALCREGLVALGRGRVTMTKEQLSALKELSGWHMTMPEEDKP